MALITLDFETTYSTEYSLTKMSETDYILDPRFEIIMCSVKLGDQPTEVFVGHAAAARLGKIDWSKTAMLAHNVRFDGGILAWVFGHVPAMYLDTLSMSRATTHWTIGRSSLAKVAEYLGLPAKGNEVIKARGKRLADFTPDELVAYQAYCARDTDLCHAIFTKLKPRFRASEFLLIDMIARMFVLPQVKLNPVILSQNYQRVLADKAEALTRVGEIPKEVFSSNLRFAALLEEHGVEVPTKLSPTTGEYIPALAKGDWAFKELCANDTLPIDVQLLLAARTSVKSTLEETRSRMMLSLAERSWRVGKGWAPIPLKFSGARTHRLSGDGGANWQNLPRGSLLRTAIEAPTGWRIVHRDASQIEARMVAWMAACHPLLEAFAEGRDVYSEFASLIYARGITKVDTLERFVGKTAILGLGYGCGADKFRKMLFIGNGGISLKVDIEVAEHIVHYYRGKFPEIPDLWEFATRLLRQIIRFTNGLAYIDPAWDPVFGRIPIRPDYDSLVLPNDLKICYPELRSSKDMQMHYTDPQRNYPIKIYGAKVCENVSQALSRIIITDIAIRMRQLTGYRPFLTTHDSLDYVVPDGEASSVDAELARQFATVPAWAEGLPLASEGGYGVNLTAAERRANN